MTFRLMIWVVGVVEKVVRAIDKPELKEIIEELVQKKSSPAYYLINYFYVLDTSDCFDDRLKHELDFMVKNYNKEKFAFLNRIISIRTQHYERTHRIKEEYRQSIFSLLNLKYKKQDAKQFSLIGRF